MGLINVTDIQDGDEANESLFNSRFATIVDLLNGQIDADNLADDAITTPKIANDAVIGSKIASYWGYEQDGAGTDTEHNDLRFDYGWGYIAGDSSADIEKTVNFRSSFTSPPVVLISPAGYSAGTPTAITDFTGSTLVDWSSYTRNITTASFIAVLTRSSGSFGGSQYGFTWIAIGRK